MNGILKALHDRILERVDFSPVKLGQETSGN